MQTIVQRFALQKEENMLINNANDIAEEFLNPQYIKTLMKPQENGGNITVGLSRWPKGKAGHLHKHDGWDEYFYILSGQGVIVVGQEKHQLKKGTAIRIPKGVDHAIIDSGEGEEELTMVFILSPTDEESDNAE